MSKHICIHGHFYQPPRENPWLESVELQDSASPYHDWNERVTYECYAPNARARLLDDQGLIRHIVSNYSRMSFNFGPALLSWMKEKLPEIHDAIVDADKKSRERFSGHGSALAQGYNHMILPLANARDKRTQVLWGIRDFESRFGRQPEGMWLPETAADNASLEVLAELGIKFTILSPYQANRVRPLGDHQEWQDVNGAKVDPSVPYVVKLSGGRSIVVFFYDAPIAQAIAFERLLEDGGKLASRLTGAFAEDSDHDLLVNVATDGESYGHHFQYGDMALAFALTSIEQNPDFKLTVYAEFLDGHPPAHEAEIHQGSAWSCPHGVGRWKENCGCNSGRAGWNQEWRAPLREALDWLRDQLAPVFEAEGARVFKDAWQARDEYVSVILDRSPDNTTGFLARHANHALNETEQLTALRLLEMQRHAMLMYTSCGWFFDEISGLETVQVIQYAARVIQLAGTLPGGRVEEGFLRILEKAKSNIPENNNGRVVYEKFAQPALMTREKVAAHYAISSLFETYPEEAHIYAFIAKQIDRQLFKAGNTRLVVGTVKITFVITRETEVFHYAVVHMGDHNLNCGVSPDINPQIRQKLGEETHGAFERGDFPELIRIMDKYFGAAHYSIKDLFRDEQRKVLNQILAATREEILNTYRLLTDRYANLTRFLNDLRVPPLSALTPATEFVLNSELRRQFDNGHLDTERIKSLMEEVRVTKAALDADMLAFAIKKHLDRMSDEILKTPEDLDLLQRYSVSTSLVKDLPVSVNLWKPQNTYDQLLGHQLGEMRQRADEKSRTWVHTFLTIGHQLGFHVDN